MFLNFSVPVILSSKAGTSAAELSGCQWCRKGPHWGLAGGVAVPGYVGDRCNRGSCGPGPHRSCQGQSCSQHGAPRQAPAAGGKPPALPVILVRRTLSLQLWLPWHAPEEVSVAGLAASFPLGRAGSWRWEACPFWSGKCVCVLSQSFGANSSFRAFCSSRSWSWGAGSPVWASAFPSGE